MHEPNGANLLFTAPNPIRSLNIGRSIHQSPANTRPTPTLAATWDATGNTSISAGGNKTGLIYFDGKADGFSHWRRRLASYISDEDVAYGKVVDWARQQPNIITEEVENNNASDIAEKIGLVV